MITKSSETKPPESTSLQKVSKPFIPRNIRSHHKNLKHRMSDTTRSSSPQQDSSSANHSSASPNPMTVQIRSVSGGEQTDNAEADLYCSEGKKKPKLTLKERHRQKKMASLKKFNCFALGDGIPPKSQVGYSKEKDSKMLQKKTKCRVQ